MNRPNILLITVECFRADHFGVLTPNLARLGKQSVVFDDAHVLGGWTLPSMTAMMSSAYASMHGGPNIALSTPKRKVLSESLLQAGYWTAGITANPVCGIATGFHRGFGRFKQLSRKVSPHPSSTGPGKKDFNSLADAGVAPCDLEVFAKAEAVTDNALEWLRKLPSGDPWFLWLHYLDPHWPYLATARPSCREDIYAAWIERDILVSKLYPNRGRFALGATGEQWVSRYRSSLQAADYEIGRLLNELEQGASWDRTIVAVTGDHGEEFEEHGTWLHQWNQLHKEGIHVPLLLRLPAIDGRNVAEAVSHLDLTPTLLHYAGVEQAPEMLGQSLHATLESNEPPLRSVYTEMLSHPDSVQYALAIRDGRWKYIQNFDNPHSPELYNVDDDPNERTNLVNTLPELRWRFETLKLQHCTKGVIELMSRPPVEPTDKRSDEIVKDQMEALGYL